MTELLDGLNSMVWVYDVIFWGHDEDDLLHTLELVLERLESVGLFAAARNVSSSTRPSTGVERCTHAATSSTILSG